MKTTDQIISIVRAGGSVIIDSSKTTDQLISIVRAAGQKNQITIKKAGSKTTDQLISIARAGCGNVVLDMTE